MLLYSRISPRLSCLLSTELLKKEDEIAKTAEVDSSQRQYSRCLPAAAYNDSLVDIEQSLSNARPGFKISCEEDLSLSTESEDAKEDIRNLVLQHREELPYTSGKVTFRTNTDILPNSCQTSMIHNTSTQFDTQECDSSTSISDGDSANQGSEKDAYISSLRKSTVESRIAENCFIKEGSITGDVSDMDTIMTDVQDEVTSGNFMSIPNNAENENRNGKGYASSYSIENAGENAGRERSSLVKYTPLSSPGFLGKHLRMDCVPPENFAGGTCPIDTGMPPEYSKR